MKRSLLLLGLLFPISLLEISCLGHGMIVFGGDPPPMVVYSYWYYPAWGVYYDYDAHVYFYLGGSTWVRTAYLPPRFHGLGRHVIVESERGRPWARYEDHRAKYPPPGHFRKEMREDEGDRGPGHGRHHFDDD